MTHARIGRRALPFALALGLCASGCEDAETLERRRAAIEAADLLDEGRTLLDDRRYVEAVERLQRAVAAAPRDPRAGILLARAHRGAGSDAAAVLELKRIDELTGEEDVRIGRELGRLLVVRDPATALPLMERAERAGEATVEDRTTLAELRARTGASEGAFATLAELKADRPEDPEIDLTGIRIRFILGDELGAAQQLDALIARRPGFAGARIRRAQYFLDNGFPGPCLAELAALPALARTSAAVQVLEGRAHLAGGAHEKAAGVLTLLLEQRPGDTEALGLLARAKAHLGEHRHAELLAVQALGSDPAAADAWLAKGMVGEANEAPSRALEAYREAVAADPRMQEALERLWPLERSEGHRSEASRALEQLATVRALNVTEKAALASLLFEERVNLDKARALIKEVIAAAPHEPAYRELAKKLAPPKRKRPQGPTIIRGGR